MKKYFIFLLGMYSTLSLLGCSGGGSPENPTLTPIPTPTPIPFYFPINIDYSTPQTYLTPGTQSNLSDTYFNEVKQTLSISDPTLKGIEQVFQWVKKGFSNVSGGGKLIGINTVDQIYSTKSLTGCHDWGLIISCLLRRFGYPTVMVDCAGIQWANDFQKGLITSYAGHVFCEVYVGEKWILLDSTSGQYIREYNPKHPVIPVTKSVENKGYYVVYKGVDPAEYGVASNKVLHARLAQFAQAINSIQIEYPSYQIEKF